MDTKMKHAAQAELAKAARRRYRLPTSKEKISDEFVAATTGYHENSAIRVAVTAAQEVL